MVFIELGKISEAISDLELALELGYSRIYDSEVDELLNGLKQNKK